MSVGHRVKRAAAAAAMLATAILPAPAIAQQLGMPMSPGEFRIEGVLAICGEVETVFVVGDAPLISSPNSYTLQINRDRFNPLPPGVRLFIYYQTCGMLGYRMVPDGAFLADSYATRRGLGERWLAAADIEAICESQVTQEAGWTAGPDAERCAAIYQVIQQALQ